MDKKERMKKLFAYLKEKFPSDRPDFEREKDTEVKVPEDIEPVNQERPRRLPIEDEEEKEKAFKFMKSFKKTR